MTRRRRRWSTGWKWRSLRAYQEYSSQLLGCISIATNSSVKPGSVCSDHEPSSGCAAIEFTPVCYIPPSEFTGAEETRGGLTKLPTAIAAVLSLLPDLTIFHCSGHQEKRSSITLLTLLEHVSAPSLHEFKLDITEDILNVRIDHQWAGRYNVYTPRAPLPYFLQRHLHLRRVFLGIEDTMPDNYLETFALSMPKLEQFKAPIIYFLSLPKDTPLKHASISLINFKLSKPLPVRLDQVLVRLQSSVELKSLTLRMENIDHETIKVIVRRLPDLDQLEIRHELYMYRLPISMVSISAITHSSISLRLIVLHTR